MLTFIAESNQRMEKISLNSSSVHQGLSQRWHSNLVLGPHGRKRHVMIDCGKFQSILSWDLKVTCF